MASLGWKPHGQRRFLQRAVKRELPRIPYAPDFWAFAKGGKRLAELHVDYENQPEWRLTRQENPDAQLSFRVEKMKLTRDRSGIVYNDFLTLNGIPEEAFEYRLGNRSAIEWVLDQYQVSTDKRSGITNDPNRLDDPEYIIRLIGQVITVSVETVKIVRGLPPLGVEDEHPAANQEESPRIAKQTKAKKSATSTKGKNRT